MTKTLLAGIAGLMLVACSGNKADTQPTGVVDIQGALANKGEVTTSQLGSKISFIPLETNDSVLVGNKYSMWTSGDKLVLSNVGSISFGTEDAAVMVFDLNTGKHIANLGRRGQGPEDFGFAIPTVHKNSDKVSFKAGSGDGNVIYSTDGKFKGRFTPRFDGDEYTDLRMLAIGDSVVTMLENNVGDESRRLVFRTFALSGEQIDSMVVFDGQPFPSTLLTISGPATFHTYEDPFTHCGHTIATVKDSQKTSLFVGVTTEDVGNTWHIHEELCDTVFALTPTGASPSLIFDFGSNGFPFSELNMRMPTASEMYVMQIIESPSKALFSFSEGWLADDGHKTYIGLYDRATGKTTVTDAKNGIRDDLADFMPFSPVTTTADGKWVGVLTMEEIEDWLEEHPDAERPAALANSTAEDNPVLVIISE